MLMCWAVLTLCDGIEKQLPSVLEWRLSELGAFLSLKLFVEPIRLYILKVLVEADFFKDEGV